MFQSIGRNTHVATNFRKFLLIASGLSGMTDNEWFFDNRRKSIYVNDVATRASSTCGYDGLLSLSSSSSSLHACRHVTSCEQQEILSFSQSSLFSPASATLLTSSRRRQTDADAFFSKYSIIPKPKIMHSVLELPENKSEESSSGILVIGDVHGCFKELLLLYEKAVKINGDIPFRCVVLVGDLCNKGPESAQVIRFARVNNAENNNCRWFSVRGNHDDGALAAALGDPNRRKKETYQWVVDGEKEDGEKHAVKKGVFGTKSLIDTDKDVDTDSEICNSNDNENSFDKITLSDEDVEWLSELPYTLRIPGAMLGEKMDTIIVHAGLVPGVDPEKHSIETMVTLREIKSASRAKSQDDDVFYVPHTPKQKDCHDDSLTYGDPVPWASIWEGPERIIFGHDAKRGYQRYEGDWAIGLDTGACYGNQLTGIIIPQKKIVTVDSLRTYCPIKEKN